jgi:hypothetical protein
MCVEVLRQAYLAGYALFGNGVDRTEAGLPVSLRLPPPRRSRCHHFQASRSYSIFRVFTERNRWLVPFGSSMHQRFLNLVIHLSWR